MPSSCLGSFADMPESGDAGTLLQATSSLSAATSSAPVPVDCLCNMNYNIVRVKVAERSSAPVDEAQPGRDIPSVPVEMGNTCAPCLLRSAERWRVWVQDRVDNGPPDEVWPASEPARQLPEETSQSADASGCEQECPPSS